MGNNIIFYGPPGTGKTYLLQQLKTRFTGFNIDDNQIVNAYINSSKEWILVTLVILQGENLMSSDDIQEKIESLPIPSTHDLDKGVSTILNKHSVVLSPLFTAEVPQIFNQKDRKWYVELDKLLAYDIKFYEKYLSSESIEERYKFVTFHQSFVYEDFVEGIRPLVNIDAETDLDENQSSGQISYSVVDGVFKQICDEALKNSHKDYAIFIDEINRGNISEIFGELITLVEVDKRIGEDNQLEVTLPYSKQKFGVPKNLNIFGTMNSADRSISLIDVALRRRFKFINMTTNLELLSEVFKNRGLNPNNIDGIDIIKLLEKLNARIEVLLDANFVIGHAYFSKVNTYEDLKEVIINQIVPLLEEYFYDDLEKVQLVFNDLNQDGELKENAIYKHKELAVEELFDYLGDYDEYESKKSYFVNRVIDKSSLIKIYTN